MEIPLAQGYVLRPWRPGDEAALAKYANNFNIWINVRNAFPHPYTLEDARAHIARHNDERPPATFAIATRDQAIGNMAIHLRSDVARRSAEIGYWLGEPYWGKGIVTMAVRAIVQYAFDTFDLARVWAEVFETNPASARVLEKAGLTFEARLRKAVTKNGKTMDSLLYAVVKD